MKILRIGCTVIAAVLTLTVAALVIGFLLRRHALQQKWKDTQAEAEKGARTYIAKLQPAFDSGPQTLTSLKQLEVGTSVDDVTASTDGTSVVVLLASSVHHPGSWSGTDGVACYRVVLSRVNGSVTQQVSDTSCAFWQATPDPGERRVTDPNEKISVG